MSQRILWVQSKGFKVSVQEGMCACYIATSFFIKAKYCHFSCLSTTMKNNSKSWWFSNNSSKTKKLSSKRRIFYIYQVLHIHDHSKYFHNYISQKLYMQIYLHIFLHKMMKYRIKCNKCLSKPLKTIFFYYCRKTVSQRN